MSRIFSAYAERRSQGHSVHERAAREVGDRAPSSLSVNG
jgi:hypothetical protein